MSGTKNNLKALEDASILAWILENQIKTERGDLLEFHHHRYLKTLYADNSPNIVEMKGAQLGLSTMEIIRTLWKAKNQKMDVIYILPTFTDVKDFAGGKVNRIVDQNPVLRNWIDDKDSVELKKVGSSTIYYRGSWNERQALMISSDWIIGDEYDRSKQDVLEQYESRLQHSKFGYKSIFSNPSLPGVGVDKFFQKTDQKKWHVTHACGAKFILDESCVDYDRQIFKCPSCYNEITNEERRLGEWLPTAKGEEGWSGYWIPLWVNPLVSAKKICEYKTTKTADYFHNFVAGLPYAGGDDKIDPATVLKNCVDKVNEQGGRIIIGVDTGLPIHFTVANQEGVFYYGTTENYKELDDFMRRWKTAILIADQGGDLIGIREMREKYNGRVFLCYYQKDKKSLEVIRWGEGGDYGEVHVDRNKMIQLMVEQLKDLGRIRFNGTVDEWSEFAEHFGHIYREKVIVTEAKGKDDKTLYGTEYVWKRDSTNRDHYVHSLLYTLVGLDKFGVMMAKVMGDDPLEGIAKGQVIKDEGVVLTSEKW